MIFLDSVQCSGSERFLNECTSDPLTVHNCGHNKDAGVICQGIEKKDDDVSRYTIKKHIKQSITNTIDILCS